MLGVSSIPHLRDRRGGSGQGCALRHGTNCHAPVLKLHTWGAGVWLSTGSPRPYCGAVVSPRLGTISGSARSSAEFAKCCDRQDRRVCALHSCGPLPCPLHGWNSGQVQLCQVTGEGEGPYMGFSCYKGCKSQVRGRSSLSKELWLCCLQLVQPSPHRTRPPALSFPSRSLRPPFSLQGQMPPGRGSSLHNTWLTWTPLMKTVSRGPGPPPSIPSREAGLHSRAR